MDKQSRRTLDDALTNTDIVRFCGVRLARRVAPGPRDGVRYVYQPADSDRKSRWYSRAAEAAGAR